MSAVLAPRVLADGGALHQAAQAWPIQLGTSGGNINDRSTLYCCSGTLGSLVEDAAGNQYILSNNHVLAKSNLGVIGDDVNQPGQIDQGCGQSGVVADLSAFVPLQFRKGKTVPLNQADCAIAAVRAGAVSADGAILDIGPVSAQTVSAFVGQTVQKSGRTTGLTNGSVAAINVTIDVGYSKECGGAANQVARFSNQVRITPGTFSAGGDSGSLIVERGTVSSVDGLPRAVGLLFAGSSTSTFACPIGAVLGRLNVVMAGGTSAKSAPGASPANAKAVGRASAALAQNSAALFAKSGVIGHGVGLSGAGRPVIEVYVESDDAKSQGDFPKQLDNVPVRVVVTGPCEAL